MSTNLFTSESKKLIQEAKEHMNKAQAAHLDYRLEREADLYHHYLSVHSGDFQYREKAIKELNKNVRVCIQSVLA